MVLGLAFITMWSEFQIIRSNPGVPSSNSAVQIVNTATNPALEEVEALEQHLNLPEPEEMEAPEQHIDHPEPQKLETGIASEGQF